MKFYKPELPINISCYASMKGLGVQLKQKHNDIWHPVSHTSSSLTSAENNYCQLEKKIMSIVFACDKFHEFIYRKQLNIHNYHLPQSQFLKKH